MPVDDVLTPMGASYIATNAYFTLKDCMRYDPSNPGSKPQAAAATRSNGQNRVFGPGNAGRHDPRNINPTLHNTGLASANLSRVFSGNTGLSTCSGFCYLLQYKQDTRRHVVIAPRGTRPELGAPDLLTDLRGAMTSFASYGPVQPRSKASRPSMNSAMLRFSWSHLSCVSSMQTKASSPAPAGERAAMAAISSAAASPRAPGLDEGFMWSLPKLGER
jgi:hypothetical protein